MFPCCDACCDAVRPGCAANVMLVFFFLSPLATLLTVLRRRDSASLVLPLCIMNILNGALWGTYGLVRSDAFLWAPNLFGACLGVLQTVLRLSFPQRTPAYQATMCVPPSFFLPAPRPSTHAITQLCSAWICRTRSAVAVPPAARMHVCLPAAASACEPCRCCRKDKKGASAGDISGLPSAAKSASGSAVSEA